MEEQVRIVKLALYFIQIVMSKIAGRSISEIIFAAVSDFGGVYIKLIQFVCLRTNILSPEDKLHFLNFYDSALIEPIDIQAYVTRALGEEKTKQFAFINPTPFASGTFGQVYRARLADGSDVVIKVKRPHLVRKLTYDFFILRVFTKIFNLLLEQSIINLDETLSEFRESTYQELDYLQESKNADYFYRTFRGHPRLYIPRTYLELCTRDILVQEYVGGVAATDLIRHNARYPGVY
ncbi:AarF/ABC1/UbiB kinase family protein, partial [Candidatus Gottesmanbacteria bacterium]|nr:AarF/ABC1/UbiB kinase family protein [Candidatus Gottesmanbacteria bacterium]